MAEEGKKISFGFSKVIKKPLLQNAAQKEEKKVEYIESVDDKAIKVIGGEEAKEDGPLVIPMLGSKTWHERIVNKTDADIFEPKPAEIGIKEEAPPEVSIKQEKIDEKCNGTVQNDNGVQPMEVCEIKKEAGVEENLTLEERAAREILADLNKEDKKEEVTFTVPNQEGEEDLKGKEESSLEDYESIPIEHFGLAMLRGMGWKPGQGIGKNQKVVAPKIPELRPKGLGLGADKLTIQKKLETTKGTQSKEEQELKLAKGSFVKITAGRQSGCYGKVDGLDDDSGRVVVRMAIGDQVTSVNEFFVQPVTSTEYTENSKILNVKKYQEFNDKESSKKEKSSRNAEVIDLGDSDDENQRERSKKSKKSKKESKPPEDDDDSVSKSRGKKHPSESNSEDERPKSKKSEKHKSRDSSPERSNRKNKRSKSSDDDSSPKRQSRRRDPSNSSEDEKLKSSKKSKKHKSRDSSSERPNRKSKRSKSSDDDSSPRRQSRRRDPSSDSEDEKRKSSKKSKKHKSRDSSAERSSRKNKRKDKEREKTRHKRSDSSEKTKQKSRRRSRSRSNASKNRRRDRSRSTSPKNRRRDRSRSYSPRR